MMYYCTLRRTCSKKVPDHVSFWLAAGASGRVKAPRGGTLKFLGIQILLKINYI